MTIDKHMEKIFGTDGVRGKANLFPMTVEVALALGRAAGVLFRRHQGLHRVVVGKDTRLSCYMFENALIAGLCSMGIDTLMVGPFPTPGIAFITRAYRADAGIMISASHNPYYDNGIKFFSNEGYKLPDEMEDEMVKMVAENDFAAHLPADDQIGRNAKVTDGDGRYIEFCKATFPKNKNLHGLKVVLDCANGAAHRVAPLVFKELDAEVFVYGNQPNGLNINLHCGSLHPEIVQKGVIDHQADIGVALDGDADRVILVDENSQIVDGDVILAICARDMLQQGILKDKRVIATQMSNLGMIRALENLGIEVILAKVGDRHVIQQMLAHGANLGGEQSGHLIFHDHNTTGDGIVAALQVMKIMIETGSKLSELAEFVKRYPQALVNVPVISSKPPISEVPAIAVAIEKAEKELGKEGRILVRYSGTEPLCRVMVEGPTIKLANTIAKEIAQAVTGAIGV